MTARETGCLYSRGISSIQSRESLHALTIGFLCRLPSPALRLPLCGSGSSPAPVPPIFHGQGIYRNERS